MSERNLTDDDVKAIAAELKRQFAEDFQIEVGTGLLVWVKRALFIALVWLALQGMAGDRDFLQTLTATRAQ